jgi:hypothetical protein
MDNNNVVLQINERQSFQCRRTSKSHSFAVGIELIITDCKYGLRPIPLLLVKNFRLPTFKRKIRSNGLYNIPIQMRILKIVEQDRGIKYT